MSDHPSTNRLRMRLHALLLAFCIMSFTGAAAAQGDSAGGGAVSPRQDDFARPGGYVSIGVGGASPMFTGSSSVLNDLTSQALLVGLRGGQRLNKVVALDFSLDYAAVGFKADDVLAAGVTTEINSLSGFGNLKLYPFGGRIQPYAMGGAGFVWSAYNCISGGVKTGCGIADDVAFAGRAGGGLDIYLTRNIALTGEVAYVIPTGNISEAQYLSYSGHLLFRF